MATSLAESQSLGEGNNRELCLLSLDGGGVRGLSTLYILDQLMEQVNRKAGNDPPRKPCDYFDIIAGTSTGGLIAVMLGRLRMSVQECISTYICLSDRVFEHVHHRVNLRGQTQGRFDHVELENCIKEAVQDVGLPEDALLKDETGNPCKVFVLGLTESGGKLLPFTNYKRQRGSADLYEYTRIWEACRATSAATTFFDPITISFGPPGAQSSLRFIDAALGHNNPIVDLWTEATDIWAAPGKPLETQLKCVVSIGTGEPSLKDFGPGLLDVGERLKEIATETEDTANAFFNHHIPDIVDSRRYYRFNVPSLAEIGLEEAKKKDKVIEETKGYIERGTTYVNLQNCAKKLAERLWSSQQMLIVQSLSSHNCASKHQALRVLRTRNTGTWLLTQTHFLTWVRGRSTEDYTVWCHGLPSSGKTFISSLVIDHLDCLPLPGAASAICYGVCDNRGDDALANMMGCLLRQLLFKAPAAPKLFLETFPVMPSRQRPLLCDLVLIMTAMCNHFETIFLLADDMHKLNVTKQLQFISILESLGKMRLFLTSRSPFSKLESSNREPLEIEIRTDRDDLKKVLLSKMETVSDISDLFYDNEEFRDETISRLLQKSGNRYDAAEMYLRSVQHATTPGEVREILANDRVCPNTLLAATLQRIEGYPERMRRLAWLTLTWVMFAERPLTVAELLQALTIRDTDTVLQKHHVPSERRVFGLCLGLIVKSEESRTVYLRASSDQASHQYLEEKVRGWYDRDIEGVLGIFCVRFLSFGDFSSGPCDSAQELHARLEGYPFLRYAARYWADHVRKTAETESPVQAFLTNRKYVECAAQVVFNSSVTSEGELKSFEAPVHGIHQAIKFGLNWAVCSLVDYEGWEVVTDDAEEGALSNVTDRDGRTPLHLAAFCGNIVIIHYLLEKGAAFHKPDYQGKTPIITAAEQGHRDAVMRFLAKDPDALQEDYSGNTAVHYAIRGPPADSYIRRPKVDYHLVSSLLERWQTLGKPNLVTYSKDFFLLAISRWDRALVKTVLESGIHIGTVKQACDVFEAYNASALHEALDRRDGPEMMAQLVRPFALERVYDKTYPETPLHRAAECGNLGAVNTLLSHGATPNVKTLSMVDSKDTPLHLAAVKGHAHVAESLLLYGADVNARNEAEKTPLIMAAQSGDLETVRVLLRRGADVNAKDYYKDTAIGVAKSFRSQEVIQLLEDYQIARSTG